MDKKYLVTRMEGAVYSFLLDGAKAVEIHCDTREEGLLGGIYIGKIKNIVKNLNAAFVEIAPGQPCYLALEDMAHAVYTKKGASAKPQAGDELVVQVSREGMKTKAPAVTANLTLSGKYLLLTTGAARLSASSKLPKQERARLLELLKELLGGEMGPSSAECLGPGQGGAECQNLPAPREPAGTGLFPEGSERTPESPPVGWLLRTNACGADRETLKAELGSLLARYRKLLHQARYRTAFTCLYRTPAPWLARLTGLYTAETEQILTDDRDLYGQMEEYLREHQPEDLKKLALYQERLLPMKKLYALESQLSEALASRVWLKSGGYLVIEPTEALTVVDVNSGKCIAGKRKEEALLKINREAARETARQIRLRNLSGIILVDFINMESESSNESLLSLLSEELGRDPVRTVLVDRTKLSLVEITRQKREKPLGESIPFRAQNGRPCIPFPVGS